ncbi:MULTISPECIES: alpha/beta fold hydrolase [unclassified Brachybacterium]|uniref:alpha/beta fold hydrolase n=1 Tax=unclassified Brachybacterium TaxID=2623841 RepID=UPI00361A91F3
MRAAPRPVVLVHGARTSASQWDRQVPSLRAAGHRVITPEMPGHGARRGEPFTLAAALAAITEAIETAAGPERRAVHLVGSSLGGMLAIQAAAEIEDRELLASLVVVGASAQPTARTAWLYGLAITATDLLPGTRERGSGGPPPALAAVLGRAGARAYVRGGRAGTDVVPPAMSAVASLDLLGALSSISAPVTILNPRVDQFRLHERAFADAAPRGRLEVLGYGTHLVNLGRSERFTPDLLRILARTERSI